MTIYAFEAQESWLPTAIGLTCSSADVDEESGTLSLAFYRASFDVDPDFIEPERAVTMSGVWRVEQEEEILAASGDVVDPERAARLDRLVGRELVRADVSHPGYDLALHLTGAIVARCFPCDSLQFGEDLPEEGDVFVSWWVDGIGVPDDWEEPNEAFFSQPDGR